MKQTNQPDQRMQRVLANQRQRRPGHNVAIDGNNNGKITWLCVMFSHVLLFSAGRVFGAMGLAFIFGDNRLWVFGTIE